MDLDFDLAIAGSRFSHAVPGTSNPWCKVILQRLCNHLEQLKPDPQPPKEWKL
jgi:hypothetical protein